jgi:peptidoglycan/LPS O-acetylase OafA/YrhL
VYLERITHRQFSGRFDFVQLLFEGIYFGGNFAFMGMHLWYLLVLFAFSIVLLPLFLLLKSKIDSRVLAKLMDLISLPGLVYVLALIILLAWKLIDRNSLLGFDKFDWNLGVYMSFSCSALIMASARLQQSVQRPRWISRPDYHDGHIDQ